MEAKWVVYHVKSTMEKKVFKMKHAAEKFAAKLSAEYAVASIEKYAFEIVHMVEKTNLIGGGKYMEASNTPGYLSPSSEAYWSM